MKHIAFLALTLTLTTTHALDLTPRFAERDMEGIKIPIVHFSDGRRTVIYQAPARWNLSGGGQDLKIRPPDLADASLSLRVLARRADMVSLASSFEMQAWVLSLLPRGAKKPTSVSEARSPFTIGAHVPMEYRISYVQDGVPFTKAITAVDLNDQERFVIAVTARTNDFKSVHEEAVTSMFSWQCQ